MFYLLITLYLMWWVSKPTSGPVPASDRAKERQEKRLQRQRLQQALEIRQLRQSLGADPDAWLEEQSWHSYPLACRMSQLQDQDQ